MGKVRVFSDKFVICGLLLGAFGCSAFDNSATPSHALGAGGDTQADGGASNNGGAGGPGDGGRNANGGGGASTNGGASAQAGASGSSNANGGGGASNDGGASSAGANAGGTNAGGSHSAGSSSGGASAGTAGTSNGSCADHPLTPETMWIATASNSGGTDVPAQAIDGNADTRWTSGKDQSGDEWFQLDFGKSVTIDTVTLRLGKSTGDYPRSYQMRLTDTSNNLSAAAQVSGSGMDSVDTVMKLQAPTTGRYLLITQGGTTTGIWWSIAEFAITCGS